MAQMESNHGGEDTYETDRLVGIYLLLLIIIIFLDQNTGMCISCLHVVTWNCCFVSCHSFFFSQTTFFKNLCKP